MYQNEWHVGNSRSWVFEFHKADYRIYSRPSGQSLDDWLLAGAHFSLFRFIGTGEPAADEMIFVDNIGTRWEEVTLVRDISTGNIATLIWYNIDPRFTYQLVETLAPVGFQRPWSQWRIEVGDAPAPAPAGQRILLVETITSGPSPTDFINEDGVWILGNILAPELPLAGGTGTMIFRASGTVLVSMATALLILIFIIRQRKILYK